MVKDSIVIKGARVHNLKNIDVDIPHGSFTVLERPPLRLIRFLQKAKGGLLKACLHTQDSF
jgi:hypothetical protein